MSTHYLKRDAYMIDCESDTEEAYYAEHVSAMTKEGLHSKSDIAAELAVRDIHIQYLCELVEQYSGVPAGITKSHLPTFEAQP